MEEKIEMKVQSNSVSAEQSEPVLLDVHQLARRLNVPKTWIYSRTASGEIPFIKMGHYCRFDWNKIKAWLRASEVR